MFSFFVLFLCFRGKWVLLDGDKIAALCAAFIHEELTKLGLDKVMQLVVQTGVLVVFFTALTHVFAYIISKYTRLIEQF